MADKPDFKVFGTSGLNHTGGVIQEEWHQNLQGEKGVKVYKEMSVDPTGGAALGIAGGYIKQTLRHVEPSDASDPKAVEWAEFMQSCFDDMSHTFQQYTDEELTALIFGWAYFNVPLKVRLGPEQKDPRFRSQFNDGKIGIRKIELRAQETLDKWEIDDDGGIRGMWQRDPRNYFKTEFIPIESSLLFRPVTRKNDPEGVSVFRCGYTSYYYKNRITEKEAQGIEADASGVPHLQVPAELMDSTSPKYSASLISGLEKKVMQIRSGARQGLVTPSELDSGGMPTGWKLQLMRSGGGRMFDASATIQRHKTDFANSILYTGFMTLGEGPNGSRSLGDNKTDMFSTALGAYLDASDSHLTRYVISRVMRANSVPPDLWPHMAHDDVKAPPLEAVADYVQKLGAHLSPTPELEERLLEIANLPVSAQVEAELDAIARGDIPEPVAPVVPEMPEPGMVEGDDVG